MSQSVPDFTTVIITISFLLILGIVAFLIKKKSSQFKKIIKKENSLEVINQTSLNSGFLAYVFKVDEEKFFFVGHKSGRGSLTQIKVQTSELENSNKTKHINISTKNKLQPEKLVNEKTNVSKPLQHVNISDLLTAHKKGNKDA